MEIRGESVNTIKQEQNKQVGDICPLSTSLDPASSSFPTFNDSTCRKHPSAIKLEPTFIFLYRQSCVLDNRLSVDIWIAPHALKYEDSNYFNI